MKVKKLFLFAAAAAMFAACSDDGLTKQTAQQTSQGDAVSFEAYMQRPVTRAGATGPVTTDSLKSPEITTTGSEYYAYHNKAGFGVFAYYTDNFDYTPLYQPNFMYNEQVTWDGSTSAFKYGVTKYWPNEHGSAATSADMDRVSFFAYLPWVDTDPATGMLKNVDVSDPTKQWGIMGMKRNSLQGDPIIQYITSFDQNESVDLCWGTTGANDITWSTNSSTQTIAKGKPWLNVRKPDGVGSSDDSKVYFTFRHATAKLKVTVQTDNTSDWKATDDAAATKVWIRSIRFTGMAKKAALNLNNPVANKARWIDYYGTNELEMGESVTIYDGRKDGSEGVAGAESVNETVLGLNPQLIQDENQLSSGNWLTSGTGYHSGVPSASSANLFCAGTGAATGAVYVIPTGEKVDVEIVYDIETIDDKLPVYLSDGETHGSTIENRIYKQSVFTKLESGKSYILNLKLGMKDVKFNAVINEDWGDDINEDVYLPLNMPSYAAATGVGATINATLPASTKTFKFAVTGLNANSSVTLTQKEPVNSVNAYGNIDFSSDAGKTNANGITYVSATIQTDVINKTTDEAVVVSDGTNKVKIKLVQTATPLGLTEPDNKGSLSSYQLKKTVDSNNWMVNSSDGTIPPYIYVSLDGTSLTKGYVNDAISESTVGVFNFNFNTGTLYLPEPPGVGKKIRVTIKTGDVAAETITFTVLGS